MSSPLQQKQNANDDIDDVVTHGTIIAEAVKIPFVGLSCLGWIWINIDQSSVVETRE